MQRHGVFSKKQETWLVARVILEVRQEAWVSRCCLRGQKGKCQFHNPTVYAVTLNLFQSLWGSTAPVLVCIQDQTELWPTTSSLHTDPKLLHVGIYAVSTCHWDCGGTVWRKTEFLSPLLPFLRNWDLETMAFHISFSFPSLLAFLKQLHSRGSI